MNLVDVDIPVGSGIKRPRPSDSWEDSDTLSDDVMELRSSTGGSHLDCEPQSKRICTDELVARLKALNLNSNSPPCQSSAPRKQKRSFDEINSCYDDGRKFKRVCRVNLSKEGQPRSQPVVMIPQPLKTKSALVTPGTRLKLSKPFAKWLRKMLIRYAKTHFVTSPFSGFDSWWTKNMVNEKYGIVLARQPRVLDGGQRSIHLIQTDSAQKGAVIVEDCDDDPMEEDRQMDRSD